MSLSKENLKAWIAFWPNEAVNLGQYGSLDSAARAVGAGDSFHSDPIKVKKGVYRISSSQRTDGTCDFALIVSRSVFLRDYYPIYKDVLENPLGEWRVNGKTYQLLKTSRKRKGPKPDGLGRIFR